MAGSKKEKLEEFYNWVQRLTLVDLGHSSEYKIVVHWSGAMGMHVRI